MQLIGGLLGVICVLQLGLVWLGLKVRHELVWIRFALRDNRVRLDAVSRQVER